MARKRKIDVLDRLSPEMAEKVDELGFDVEGDKNSIKVRSKIKKQLKERNRVLCHSYYYTEKKELVVFFYLIKAGTKTPEVVAKSKGLKFVPKEEKDDKNL